MEAVGATASKLAGVEMGASMPSRDKNSGRSNEQDRKDSAREAQFGDVWNKMQSQYGAKNEKPREIKKTLGKDDFMRIMIEQMKHQDPSEPFKAEKFASELAQFASVEQLSNMNQGIKQMTTANQPLERLAMTGMIGKQVVVDRERFQYTEGNKQALNYALPKDAEQVRVSVVSLDGETIAEKDIGPQKTGEQTFNWDGLRANTLPAKTGTYMLRVAAYDSKGVPIQMNPQTSTTVVGVTFEGNEPFLLVGNPNNPDKIAMKQVSRVQQTGLSMGAPPMGASPQQPQVQMGGMPPGLPPEAMAQIAAQLGGQQAAPPQQPASTQLNANAPQVPNVGPGMISFQKGVGSKTIDAGSLDPQVKAALERASIGSQVEEQMRLAQAAQAAGDEPGFPSGLSEKGGDEQ